MRAGLDVVSCAVKLERLRETRSANNKEKLEQELDKLTLQLQHKQDKLQRERMHTCLCAAAREAGVPRARMHPRQLHDGILP